MVQLVELVNQTKSNKDRSRRSVSTETTSSDEPKAKKQRLVTFSPECFDFIHNSVDENRQTRYTKMGKRKNMVFSLVGNENRLMKALLHGHGFTQGSPDNRLYNVAWATSFISGHKMKNLKPWQRLNMFPRLKLLTFKDELYTNIARSAAQFGEVYHIIPESFVVPRDLPKLEDAIKRNKENTSKPVQYIVKPTHSCEGKGIFFITDTDELPAGKKLLVSRYIEKPFLVSGLKFDLRVYVAVTSIYPLSIYVYSEGLTRFASSEYSEEIGESASYVHLTNYSLNKKSENYVRNESLAVEDHGHKWTLGALLRYLEKQGHDCKLLMLRIEDLIVKTFLSVQSTIASVTRSTLFHVGTNFHLFGFDILLDQQLKPWLLEVNLNPSLATEAPLDVLLKPQMISDLLNLICIPQVDPACGQDEKLKPAGKKFGLKRGRDGSQANRLLTEGAVERRIHEYKNRLILEEERCGGFVRIFPRENSLPLYKGIMEVCGPENYDQRVYEALWDQNGARTHNDAKLIAQAYHDFMGDCSKDTLTFRQCPPAVRKLISGWYKQTAPLYARKITEEGASYRASLPVVRKTARLRTESYSSYLRKKKEETLAETNGSVLKSTENTKEQPPAPAQAW